MKFNIHPGLKLVRTPVGEVKTEVTPSAFLKAQWEHQKNNGETPALLAFADDGLIWGKLTPHGLVTARDANAGFGPELRWETLWRLHLFAPDRELRLWKEKGAFTGCVLTETDDPDAEYYDEAQVLFGQTKRGDPCTADETSFLPVVDLGGQWHAPPIEGAGFSGRNLRLKVRHYLCPDDETGMLKVHASRLVRLYKEGA